MSEKEFDFWQDHSVNFLEMALSYTKREKVDQPDGYGKKSGGCGDTVELFLIIKNNIIETASYEIQGCMNTNACSAAMVNMLEGKTLSEAWNIKETDIIDYLETLPETSQHCAEFAIGSLHEALNDYQGKLNHENS